MRVRRIASVAAATLIMLGIPGGVTARGAETGLYGYGMSATASAISFLYNQPSFGVPTDPTFELRKVYSASDLDSGPTGHGIGSVLWPGQVIGNAPPSLLFDTVLFNPTQFDQIQPIIDQIKKGGSDATAGRSGYPVRAESFYPQGPPSDSNDLLTGRMGSSAEVDQTDGSSSTGGAGLPGIIQFGTLSSHSNTRVFSGGLCATAKLDSPCAVAAAVAKITNLDLFGAIHIDNLVATTTSISDGQKAKNEGTLTIAGLTIKDQNGKEQAKILVDQSGFHMGSQNQDPLGQLSAQVFKKYLEPQGIDLFAGRPIDTLEGATASRSLAGLVLHIDARGMKQMQKSLTDNGLGDVVQTLKNPTSNHLLDPLFGDNGVLNPTVAGFIASFFQGDQTMDVVFGSLAVSAAASPPFDDTILPPIDLPPVLGVPFTPGAGDLGGGTFGPPTTSGPGGGQALSLTPVAVKGVPLGFIAIALALALLGATRLRLFADRVMTTPAVVRCPLEDAER